MRISFAFAGAVAAEPMNRFCPLAPPGKGSFLQIHQSPTTGAITAVATEAAQWMKHKTHTLAEAGKVIPYDGYFQMGCYVDSTPQEKWTVFSGDAAVTPKACFDFCRDSPGARFFGLTKGNTCYCTPYPTLASGAGGNGGCDYPCEGDKNFICGGEVKSTVYEMHRCFDGTKEAEKDKEEAEALVDKWTFFTGRWEFVVTALTEAGQAVDVTDVRKRVLGLGGELEGLRKDTVAKVEATSTAVGTLGEAITAFSGTKEEMIALENAQRDVADKVAELSDSAKQLDAYWQEHSLDAVMQFRSIDSKAQGSSEMLGKKLPTDVNFMTPAVRKAIDCDDDPTDGCNGSPIVYLLEGDNLASLFQVYNPTKPIEGRPSLSSAEDWKKWSTRECHQTCLMTPGCVGVNVIGSSNGEMYAMTCNLKSSVATVQLAQQEDAGLLLTGMMFGSYYSMKQKDIKFNTAAYVVQLLQHKAEVVAAPAAPARVAKRSPEEAARDAGPFGEEDAKAIADAVTASASQPAEAGGHSKETDADATAEDTAEFLSDVDVQTSSEGTHASDAPHPAPHHAPAPAATPDAADADLQPDQADLDAFNGELDAMAGAATA